MSRRSLRGFVLCLSLVAAAPTALAWNAAGHMAAASIAYDELKPEVRAKVDSILAGSGMDFIAGSTWADDTRTSANAAWHYINFHFRSDGKRTENKPEVENVVWAIRKFTAVLSDRSASDKDRREALLYVVHFVADVHQPLHATARDSDAHPTGDRGGNDFHLKPAPGLEPEPRNLHFLWDMGGGLFPHVARPLTHAGEDAIHTWATQLSKSRRTDAKAVAEVDPEAWAKEGLEIAKSDVYSLSEGAAPDAKYLEKCRRISGDRIVLAGKRLAALLNRVLG